ncbi:MAG: alpha-amylase [Clostridia bacterium]|nr:alpha-amylase [Clostridia bacterium]
MKDINGMMIQYFEWYMETNCKYWSYVCGQAEDLAKKGVTSIWLPPAYKGIGGKYEVGYGVYDMYDLGEFDQKGSIPTKYGTKDEYLEAIVKLKQAGIEVYTDIVLNHKMGADEIQTIKAKKCKWDDHNVEEGEEETVEVWTKFTFPGRNGKYSDFKYNWTHFSGIDYNSKTGENAIYKLKDKSWQIDVDKEFGNFDYLMGADVDFENEDVVAECKKWGKWYLELTNADGFRLDGLKHIESYFMKDWLQYLRDETGKELYAVGEYWNGDLGEIQRYLYETNYTISLFDVPLHFNFYNASNSNGEYNMAEILDNTLVKSNPDLAVTFVDNHDTQPGQALESWVQGWFKEIAYAIILLRKEGYPCVFYGDYNGIKHDKFDKMENIDTLMILRRDKAYGEQHDYFDDFSIVGFTREGDEEHIKSGLAVIMSNKEEGSKHMYIGEKFSGKKFIDSLGHRDEEIEIDENGYGNFPVNGGSCSVWVCM